ncbi:MAG: hypothetical protein CMJ25_07330 [Phycisphaerae bacterium]|nr:hypothetical protein [Phycisphaerae bacterium]|tara:strand:- start:2915 stop:4018 length:1104 start_codon:yes stop_codon:yes gene_type:complete
MLGFTPLASAPLADSGADERVVYALTANDITTATPTVDAVSLSVVSNFVPQDITTTPVVDSAPVFEGETIPAQEIVCGAPIVDNLDVSVTSNFAANDITSGSPVIDQVDVAVVHAFTANEITTSAPVVDSATVAVTSVLTATSLGPEVTTFTVTVADNGGNKFYIDGVSNPTLALVRGQKYVFDVSDATLDGHPLVFTLSDGTSYTDGVTSSGTAGQSNATVTFLAPDDAPSSLKYVCSSHGAGMGNTISVSASAVSLRPVVDNATVSVISNFVPLDVTTSPVVDALPFFQEYSIAVFDIITGAPTLPARFVWDFQELEVDSWTNQADDGSVWSIQSVASDTWADVSNPTDTWTETADPTDTWSEAA